jgi:hypothetical protein
MGKQEAWKTLAVLSIFASLRRDRAGAEGEGGCGGPPPLSPLHSRDPKRQKAGAVQNLAAIWTIGADGLVAASPPAWFPLPLALKQTVWNTN